MGKQEEKKHSSGSKKTSKPSKTAKREKAKEKQTRKAAKRALKKEADDQAKAGRAIRKATDRAIKDLALQSASEATGAAARTAVRTARQAVRRLSPRYEDPSPAESRSVLGSWDLHMHSVFSDGSCTVDELIAEAQAAGITRIAITDHDSLSQLAGIRERARELSFPVLAGVEISACDPATGRKVHVLGFGLSATPDKSSPVERLVAPTLAARTANTFWQAWALQRQGVEFSGRHVSLDEVAAVAGASTGAYKQHIMAALTRRDRRDPDYQFCYSCWFGEGGPARREISYPAAVDAVRAIREQGGVPVLAHPGQSDAWALIPELVGAGLLGIEAYHPDHTAHDEELAFEYARRYGLFVTGGSDYHGAYGEAPSVGTCFVCPEEAGARVEGLFATEASLR